MNVRNETVEEIDAIIHELEQLRARIERMQAFHFDSVGEKYRHRNALAQIAALQVEPPGWPGIGTVAEGRWEAAEIARAALRGVEGEGE